MATEFNGKCVAGPKDGDAMTATARRVPVVSPGADTEGQLLGYYEHEEDRWIWKPERLPDLDDRLR